MLVAEADSRHLGQDFERAHSVCGNAGKFLGCPGVRPWGWYGVTWSSMPTTIERMLGRVLRRFDEPTWRFGEDARSS